MQGLTHLQSTPLPSTSKATNHQLSRTVPDNIQGLERAVQQRKSELAKAEQAFRLAEAKLAQHRALLNYQHNQMQPISRLPVELLVRIFSFVQNTVVASHVCSWWRAVALSSPRLWSSLHIHPSKGPNHLASLLTRSQSQTIEVCFCPLPPIPTPSGASPYSLPPTATQYPEDLVLSPRVVEVLKPAASRFRVFELHASIPGTWLTLLPVLNERADNLAHFHVFTTLADDVAKLRFFDGTPRLESVNMTGAYPAAHPGLLSNLTLLRLESVPHQHRPTTRQFTAVLRACPNLVSLSMLDAGPTIDNFMPTPGDPMDDYFDPFLDLPDLQALAFRDYDGSIYEGSGWFLSHVRMPNLLSLHLMQVPGRGVARRIPRLPMLQELYLWAPECPSKDIIDLLWKLPNLITLELPAIRAPLEVFAALSCPLAPPSDSVDDHEMMDLDEEFTYHSGSHSLYRGSFKKALRYEWMCPKLERLGLPYVPAAEGKLLGDALKRLHRARCKGTEDGSLKYGIQSIMAPAGRPESFPSDVWAWLQARVLIRTFQDGNMDMLFDSLPNSWKD